ncbi:MULTISPECIES: hypothetical protein [Halorussus]|uniref:hypothetical protein n=1 Tax=Halorussus TaxID=1070314 RepID=UPI0020A21FB5|nr:hypothetical protein [Halorussus vallis]USZ77265.1 hypothetical protein NGM07_08015 [Halorussus vallis]
MAEDTYTHRPGKIDGDREDADAEHADPTAPVERGQEEFNYRDWILVGVIALCFLVIPATIYVIPPVRPFKFAYLVLPLIPAILLGLTAVWSAQRSE